MYIMGKSPMLQVMPSISKFLNIEAGVELNNNVFGFMGEQTQYRVPYAVIVTSEKCMEMEQGIGSIESHPGRSNLYRGIQCQDVLGPNQECYQAKCVPSKDDVFASNIGQVHPPGKVNTMGA
jgi:hypothetical protein